MLKVMSRKIKLISEIVSLPRYGRLGQFIVADVAYRTYIIDDKLTVHFNYTNHLPTLMLNYTDDLFDEKVDNFIKTRLKTMNLYYDNQANVTVDGSRKYVEIIEDIYNECIKDLSYEDFMEKHYSQNFTSLKDLISVKMKTDLSFAMLSCSRKDVNTIKFVLNLINKN